MIGNSVIEANWRGVKGALEQRIPKEELRQRASLYGTELNWAEDHASFR